MAVPKVEFEWKSDPHAVLLSGGMERYGYAVCDRGNGDWGWCAHSEHYRMNEVGVCDSAEEGKRIVEEIIRDHASKQKS